MTEQASGSLVLHSGTNLLIGKKVVAGNTDGGEFVAVSRINGVDHLQTLALRRVLLAYTDGGIEVAQGLQMILNVTPAFVQQVIVDRAFFIDWHQFLERMLADFETRRRQSPPPDRDPF